MNVRGRDFRAEATRYLQRDYPFEVTMTEFGVFTEVPDLPGCVASAMTLEEAIVRLEEAKITWIEAALRKGLEIPFPDEFDSFSGKFVTRVSKSTHRRLARAALREGVSLNTWVAEAISLRLGIQEAEREVLKRELDRLLDR